MKKKFLENTKGFKQLACVLVFIGLANVRIFAQTEELIPHETNAVNNYEVELDVLVIGTVILLKNKVEIANAQLDLNSVWVVNANYPNIPFGNITVSDGKTEIDLTDAPVGKYYIKGKKDNRIVAFITRR